MVDDDDPRVRLHALEALADQSGEGSVNRLGQAVRMNLGHPEKRLRMAAAHLAAELPTDALKAQQNVQKGEPPLSRLTLAVADVWRHPDVAIHDESAEVGLSVLDATVDPSLRHPAVRLIILSLGDYHLDNPPVEIDTG
jgi:hypothetical protein